MSERTDFLQVAQLLELKDKQKKSDEKKANKPKRNYQMWSPADKYLLLIGLALYGRNFRMIASLYEDRSIGQVNES